MAYKSCRPEDFEALVTRYENRLYRTALAITGDIGEAEDMVQEAFLRAYEKAPPFTSAEHETAWLLRVTVNLCKSRLRSAWRQRRAPLLASYPAATAKQEELIASVLALPGKYRAVIHLYYYEGYRVKEIAGLTGRKESTVRSLLTRARQKLKSVLEEDDDESL
ncbi:MAG: RNA polymerase sigma factor [Clostridia bacterium]|nr:RNA polymerase sigma factor [Clostridia bacterium]